MLKRFFLAIALIVLPVAASADDAARAVVEDLQDGITGIMELTGNSDFNARVARLCPILDSVMAMQFQSARTVGARAWNKWDATQRDRYSEHYRAYLCALYADRFSESSGQSFHIVGERPGPRGALMILTEVRAAGMVPVAIDYVMRQQDSRWRIVDIFLDGTVSEVALRRSEFSSILRDKGFDALLAAMAAKTAAYADNS